MTAINSQVLDKFQAVIEPALDGVRVQKLIDARTILPYGLKWQLERLESVCAAGIPDDARFPERAAEKVLMTSFCVANSSFEGG